MQQRGKIHSLSCCSHCGYAAQHTEGSAADTLLGNGELVHDFQLLPLLLLHQVLWALLHTQVSSNFSLLPSSSPNLSTQSTPRASRWIPVEQLLVCDRLHLPPPNSLQNSRLRSSLSGETHTSEVLVESGGNKSGGFIALMSWFTRLYSQLKNLFLILLQELQALQRSLDTRQVEQGLEESSGSPLQFRHPREELRELIQWNLSFSIRADKIPPRTNRTEARAEGRALGTAG